MGSIELEFNSKKVKLDNFLKLRLDHAINQQKKDFDVVILIDGNEGTGKSTLSFCIAWYFSQGKLTMENLAEGTDDAISKLEHLPDKSVLIIDEGSLLFSSRDAMKKENRQLLKILNVIRQKMMILIVVAPSFFELERWLAYRRSNFLLHVYLDKKGNRGRFVYFGSKKKKLLYVIGKKSFDSYAKPRGNFVGNFFDWKLPFDADYQKLKRRSMMEALHPKKKEISTNEIQEIESRVWLDFHKRTPDITTEKKIKGFGTNRTTFYRRIQGVEAVPVV